MHRTEVELLVGRSEIEELLSDGLITFSLQPSTDQPPPVPARQCHRSSQLATARRTCSLHSTTYVGAGVPATIAHSYFPQHL